MTDGAMTTEASGRRRRRRISAAVVAALALAITVALNQPAGAPSGERAPRQTDPEPLNVTQARHAAAAARQDEGVDSVQVAVRDGVALIAIRPRPGLSPEEHRALERRVAEGIPGRVEGITEALVTTDPAVYEQIRRLDDTRRDLERRVGTRTLESHTLWVREFDAVARLMEERPNHARATAASAAGPR